MKKKMEYIPRYTIGAVPYRKQIALLKNEGNCSTVIAYFRAKEEAEEFKAWLDKLLDSDSALQRIGWEMEQYFCGRCGR